MFLIPHGIKIYCSEINDEHYNDLISAYNSNEYEQIQYTGTRVDGVSGYKFRTDKTELVLNHAKEYLNSIGHLNKQISILSQWINVTQDLGYLGPHTHNGNISYAIYLEVPNDSALIHFQLNATSNSLFSDLMTLIPKKKMILMFPSEILHYVNEYSGNCKRVSVSGNITVL
jgi:hypothetical protein